MSTAPPIPDDLWQQIPPAAQAALLALIQHYEQRLADLEARLNQNSTNSSRPPSTDPPTLKRSPPKPASGRKAGGQPGHAKCQRREVSLFVFAFVSGVEPTNNAAERAVRHGVLWRKQSHGPRSGRGSEYLSCIGSGVETCRQRGRGVWEYLTACLAAAGEGGVLPSLLIPAGDAHVA